MMDMGLIKNISASYELPEIKVVEFDYFADLRGQIWTSYSSDILTDLLPPKLTFKHDKFNTNKKNVLRENN